MASVSRPPLDTAKLYKGALESVTVSGARNKRKERQMTHYIFKQTMIIQNNQHQSHLTIFLIVPNNLSRIIVLRKFWIRYWLADYDGSNSAP